MAEVNLLNQAGKQVGSLELPDETFGIEPNVAVMHQVVTAQLAAARAGTHSTKTRAEVRGGGAKPWRQKGTGRARAGSIRSPIWVGGGRSHGPKPRDYSQRTPKKMKKLALRSALSDRAKTGGLIVVDEWKFETPKTSEAVDAIEALAIDGKSILLVISDEEQSVGRSFRNLSALTVIPAAEINTYDILCNDVLLVSLETVGLFAGGEVKATKSAKAKAKATPAAEDEGEGDSE